MVSPSQSDPIPREKHDEIGLESESAADSNRVILLSIAVSFGSDEGVDQTDDSALVFFGERH